MMQESDLRPFVPFIANKVKKANPEQIALIMQKVAALCNWVETGEGPNPLDAANNEL